MSKSPNKPDPDSSTKPDPDSNTAKSFPSLFNNFFPNSPIFNLINSTFFAHYLNNNPFIANFLIFLIVLLSSGNLYQIFINNKISDLTFQNELCKNNKELIEKDLKIREKSSIKSVVPRAVADNNNTEFLPFHCEYSIELENKQSSEKIYLRPSPVFSKYINEDYKNNGTQMDMNDVCQHPTIQDQMKKDAKNNHNYDEKKGHIIKPGKPEILENKSYAYPVHRWVCHYSIQGQGKIQSSSLIGGSDYRIDLDLVPYCKKRASDEGKKSVVPHYQNYDNPYSFYCTDPYSRPDS